MKRKGKTQPLEVLQPVYSVNEYNWQRKGKEKWRRKLMMM